MPKNGFTLVELLVGLVIAMLCTIMMLMLFKQSSEISVNSSQDANYEAQLQTGMMVAQRFIQNAGYGSGSTSDIAIGTHFNNPAVFWRYIPNLGSTPLTYSCQGIAEEVTDENGLKVHRLVLLEKINCGNNTTVTSGTWQESKAIVAIKNKTTTPIFQFSLSISDCTPFGIDSNKVGSQQLTLTAARSHLTGVGSNLHSTICLNNIKVT